MSSHELDLVGFVAGVFVLVCAAGAIGLRTGSLGFGQAPDGEWMFGALLLAVGVIGLMGSLWSVRRRTRRDEASADGNDDGRPESTLGTAVPVGSVADEAGQ